MRKSKIKAASSSDAKPNITTVKPSHLILTKCIVKNKSKNSDYICGNCSTLLLTLHCCVVLIMECHNSHKYGQNPLTSDNYVIYSKTWLLSTQTFTNNSLRSRLTWFYEHNKVITSAWWLSRVEFQATLIITHVLLVTDNK